jgi:hypothetical protein
MLLLSVLFMMAIGSVSLRGEGSSLHVERRVCWIYYFLLLDEVEYTLDTYGAQIFPHDELKYSILTKDNHSVYNISRLSFR